MRKAFIFSTLISVHLFCSSSIIDAQLVDSPCPMFNYNQKHTGQTLYSGPQNPILKWKFKTGSEIVSSPVIGRECEIYIGSTDGYLYAINPDGSERWRFKTEASIHSTPSINYDGTIYLASNDNYLYAINPDGSEKWRFKKGKASYKSGGNTYSSPVIGDDGTIYIGSSDPYLYAINPEGELKWKFKTEGDNSYFSSPAIGDDGTIYFGSGFFQTMSEIEKDGIKPGHLHAINPDGSEKWKIKMQDYLYMSPIIDNKGVIYAGPWSGGFYAINQDGTIKLKLDLDCRHKRSISIDENGTLFNLYKDGLLLAINPDGSKKWELDNFGGIQAAPTVDKSGTLYFGSDDYYIYSVRNDGTILWKYKTNGCIKSTPAIDEDGTLYIGSLDNYLYALSNSQNKPTVNIYSDCFIFEFWNDQFPFMYDYMLGVEGYNNSSLSIDLYIFLEGDNNFYFYPLWNVNPYPIHINQDRWEFELLSIPDSSLVVPGTYLFYAVITERGTFQPLAYDSVITGFNEK